MLANPHGCALANRSKSKLRAGTISNRGADLSQARPGAAGSVSPSVSVINAVAAGEERLGTRGARCRLSKSIDAFSTLGYDDVDALLVRVGMTFGF